MLGYAVTCIHTWVACLQATNFIVAFQVHKVSHLLCEPPKPLTVAQPFQHYWSFIQSTIQGGPVVTDDHYRLQCRLRKFGSVIIAITNSFQTKQTWTNPQNTTPHTKYLLSSVFTHSTSTSHYTTKTKTAKLSTTMKIQPPLQYCEVTV